MKYFHKASVKKGLPPGTVVHIGTEKIQETKIAIFDFDASQYHEIAEARIEETLAFRESEKVSWINISGLSKTDSILQIGTHFNLHPLVIEDIVNTTQRPKVEDHEDHLFIVLKMLYLDEGGNTINYEQVSLILGKTFVLSFQEAERDVFDPIRDRIRTGKGRIRAMGADYLAYALIDAVVDHYYEVLEKIGDDIEDTEET
ncbi:MAG: CorA family divalent cation transporter, partial [Desulfomonilia bacterium]